MREALILANEELKRAEHLLYVSLKYTRTADVIRSLIDRLIACMGHVIDGLLEQKEEEHAIIEVPKSPFAKVEAMKTLFKDDRLLQEYIFFYALLRKVTRAKHRHQQEFRRNVTLFVELDGKEIEINIDIVGDYFHKTREFMHFVNNTYREK